MPRGTREPSFAPRVVGTRLKKAKVVFDPSENNLPKKRKVRSISNVSKIPTNSASNKIFSLNDNESQKIKKNVQLNHLKINLKHEKSNKFELEESPPILEPQVPYEICSVCDKGREQENEIFYSCKNCNVKVHKKCLKIKFQNSSIVENNWYCRKCKTCVVCNGNRNNGLLVTCNECAYGYHYNCHIPKLQRSNINKYKWQCYKCTKIKNNNLKSKKFSITSYNFDNDNNTIKLSISSPSSSKLENFPKESLTPSLFKFDTNSYNSENEEISMLYFDIKNKEKCNEENESKFEENISVTSENEIYEIFDDEDRVIEFFDSNEPIPDIEKWTKEELSKYIEYYIPSAGHIFREQEIDGASCLLMKRQDVVYGLSLNLGSALRLYSIIVTLQTRKRDFSLTWL